MQCRSSPVSSLIPLWVPSEWKIEFDSECLKEFSNLIYILRFRDQKSVWTLHIDSVGAFSRLVSGDGSLKETPRTQLTSPSDQLFLLKFENGVLNVNGTGFSIPFDDSLIEMDWDLSQIRNRIEEPVPRRKLRTVCLKMVCSQVQLQRPIADYRPRELYFQADVNRPGQVRVLVLSENGQIQTISREISNWPFQPEKGYPLKVYPLEKRIEFLGKTHPLMVQDVFEVRIEVIQ